MRARALAAVVGTAVVATVSAVVPAHGVDYAATSHRWASAMAWEGSRFAVVAISELRATADARTPPGQRQYGCIGLVDSARDAYAVACTDQKLTATVALDSVRAVGSLRATVHRYRDSAAIGSTVIHYDLRWNVPAGSVPYHYSSTAACSRLPWASAGTGLYLASYASAEGTVSSAEMGTVRFRPEVQAWHTGVGEVLTASAGTGAPAVLPPACLRQWSRPGGSAVSVGY